MIIQKQAGLTEAEPAHLSQRLVVVIKRERAVAVRRVGKAVEGGVDGPDARGIELDG